MLSIVIPTFNRKKYLASLLEQLYKNQETVYSFKVVVIDDGSNDGTSELLKLFPDVHVINGDGNWWWTKSFNAGMIYSFHKLKVDYVLSFNDDIEIYDNFFKDLYLRLSELESEYKSRFILNCGARNILTNEYIDLGVIKNKNNPFFDKILTETDFVKGEENYKEVNHNHGRGLLITKRVFEELGELNYKVFPQYLGDSEYAARAYNKGIKMFVTKFPYILLHISLTAKTKYEVSYNIKNFFRRLTDTYSDANLKTLYRYHYYSANKIKGKFFFLADAAKSIGGYLKRWAMTEYKKLKY